jgi:NAD/NADP transhydrogenase beta subunit
MELLEQPGSSASLLCRDGLQASRQMFGLKRSLGAGYDGIANALFELPQTAIISGDTKLAFK